MRTVINNTNFGDIGVAVYYKWHKYIPEGDLSNEDLSELINLCKSDKVQYRGSRKYTSLKDFSEYSFSYDITKFKFNDQFLINLLDDSSKELIGKNIDDLEKISNVLFPTSTDDGKDYEDTFFGSSISSQTLIILGANGSFNNIPGHWKIEIYESGIESNNETYGGFIEEELLNKIGVEVTNHPIMTIILGPDSTVPNNSSDMYFSDDPQLNNRVSNTRLSLVEYKKLYEEISMYKSIWILLSQDSNEITSINLSYKSWTDNINPNRNMKDYIIRNDEYYSTKDSLKTVEKLNGTNFWFDKNSDTLVGNKIETSHPILDRKLANIKDSNEYSPYVKYKLGDKVKYGKQKNLKTGVNEDLTWVSLHSDNLGNSPILSSSWSLESSINSIFTSRLFVSSYPSNGGTITPCGSITVGDSNKIFYIEENLGYKLLEQKDGKSPVSSDIGENNYISGMGNIWNFIEEPSYGIVIYNWSPFIKTGKLVFNFQYSGCYVRFNASTPDNSNISYNQWEDLISGFELRSVIVDGEENTPSFDSSYKLNFNPNSEVTYVFSGLDKYSISEITSNTGKTIDKEEVNDTIRFTDNIDSNEILYTLHLVSKLLIVSIIESSGFEISQPITRIIYGENYEVKFYGDSFSSLKVDNSSNSVSILSSELGNNKLLGSSNIVLNYDEDTDIYILSISNVTNNLEISLNK